MLINDFEISPVVIRCARDAMIIIQLRVFRLTSMVKQKLSCPSKIVRDETRNPLVLLDTFMLSYVAVIDQA